MNNKDYYLNVIKREVVGKSVKKLRKKQQIPGCIFGIKGNYNIEFEAGEFKNLFSLVGYNQLINLNLDNNIHRVYINEVQVHPLTHDVLHVSFREVSLQESIVARIPLKLVGDKDSKAYKEDKQLIILSIDHLELRGKPRDLPQEILIDVSNFKVGDVLHISDLELPSGVSLVHSDENYLRQVVVTTVSGIEEIVNENADNVDNVTQTTDTVNE